MLSLHFSCQKNIKFLIKPMISKLLANRALEKNLEKLIETNDGGSIIYIGKSKNSAIERICDYFKSGVNSVILKLLQQRSSLNTKKNMETVRFQLVLQGMCSYS